jgi:vacuolar protein sorting-associated protein 13D
VKAQKMNIKSNEQFSIILLGTGLHPDGKSEWCHPFQLQFGSQVRRVRVAPKDSRRVDRVYIVGIEVRMGKGRYRNTQIVTLSPRFSLHNLSPYRIQYSQRCFASTFQVI